MDQDEVQLREWFDRPADAALGTAHALGDGLDLAVVWSEERQDPISLAQLEPAEHDGQRLVHARDGHGRSVAPPGRGSLSS